MPKTATQKAVQKAPNILVVIADDHQHNAIGALGHPDVRTPVLDSLVRSGTAFERTSIMGSMLPAVCLPSRACLLTGMSLYAANPQTGALNGRGRDPIIPSDAATLPQLFRQNGYETIAVGKWHNDYESLLRSFERGEAIFSGGMWSHNSIPVRDLAEIAAGAPVRKGQGMSSDLFCDTMAARLREREAFRPFFGWLALTSPHDPRTPPPEFRALYDESSLALPGNLLPRHPWDNGALDIRDELLAPRPLTPEILRPHLADYYGMISHHDAAVGRVLDALRETGEAENTIVVYLSDHGLALGQHGLMGKQNLYEHSTRVPLIISGGGMPRDHRVKEPIYSLDLYATLCELTGITPPPELESRSLLPLVQGHSASARSTFFSAYGECQRAIRAGRWKLIRYRVEGTERIQLFDLESDPLEKHDLAGETDKAPIIAVLLEHLAQWQARVSDPQRDC